MLFIFGWSIYGLIMIFMMDAQCQPQMYSLALWSIVLQLTLACCTMCCFAPQAAKEANQAGAQETAEQERLVVQAAAGEEAA